jgi:organic radical activating enzyme
MSASPEFSEVKVDALPVMEEFYTIQGEGAYTGTAAYFIRLGGCDVGCIWCDVKESWDASAHPKKSITELADRAKASGAEIVVITGGEPAMYDLETLTTALIEKGLRTHIETSGAHPLTGEWHWVCFSPKKFKSPIDAVCKKADELKVVAYNKHDFKWAETHAAKVRKDCQLYLQPEWDKAKAMTPLIIDYVKENPQWRISLQTHKYMDIP